MTKYFTIIAKNIRQAPARNIILTVFVGISIFLMNISLSRFMHREYINSLVRDCGLYDNYMYSTPPDKSAYYADNGSDNERNLRDSAIEFISQQLESLKNEGKVEAYYGSEIFNAPISADINDRATFIFYPKELVSDIKFPVSSGKWFGNSIDNECIPIVIGSDLSSRFKIGDIVTFPFLNKSAAVIGKLERNALVLTIGAGGSGVDLNDTFSSGNNAVIVCANADKISSEIGGTIIKAAPQYHKDVMKSIADVSYTFTFEDLSERAYESNKLLTEMQTVVFVLMMIVCVAGVSSGNLMETINCRKRYAIYFLCGMDWSICVRITLIENLIKLIIPSALGYWGFLKWCGGQNFYALRITDLNIFITIILIAAVYFLTALKPLFDIKRTSPVKIITEV